MLKDRFYKEFSYRIKLPKAEVIGRLMSKTESGNRLSSGREQLNGKFCGDEFVLQFKSPYEGNIWYHHSINSRIIGNVKSDNECSVLTAKVRPNIGGYLFMTSGWFMLAIFIIIAIFLKVLAVEGICFSLLFGVAFMLFTFTDWSSKYKMFQDEIENLFGKDFDREHNTNQK